MLLLLLLPLLPFLSFLTLVLFLPPLLSLLMVVVSSGDKRDLATGFLVVYGAVVYGAEWPC